jgi:hypothetical protein
VDQNIVAISAFDITAILNYGGNFGPFRGFEMFHKRNEFELFFFCPLNLFRILIEAALPVLVAVAC